MTQDELDLVRLERLLAEAAKLPREVEPPAGAWQAIKDRIDAQRVLPITANTRRLPVRPARRWLPIAAAASLLLAVGLIFTMRGRGKAAAPMAATPVAPLPIPATPDSREPEVRVPGATATPVSLSTANPALAATLDQYQTATRELEAAVSERTASLPPQTREVVRRSLATIDTAIADLRAALGQSPTDARVGQSLSAVYEQKLDFLKRVRALPGAGM